MIEHSVWLCRFAMARNFTGRALLLAALCVASVAQAQPVEAFEEHGGILAVEAEAYHSQTLDDIRRWYLTHADQTPEVQPDGDEPHVEGASGDAYLEILPDTRRTHDDPLEKGVSFSNQPGKMAVLHYRVKINTPGRYYVWARLYSTGSEDNGLHVGLNGEWPATGRRLQWCKGKHQWRWESKQRTAEVHCGVPFLIYLDIDEPGEHTISFSMREDGTEFDKWLMVQEKYEALDGTHPELDLPEPIAAQAQDE